MPAVLTVATSLPVDGRSPGKGVFADVVRGAASRRVVSRVGGGAARDTVLLRGGGFAAGTGAGLSSAGRSNDCGAFRAS
jgi:hypothetical protein